MAQTRWKITNDQLAQQVLGIWAERNKEPYLTGSSLRNPLGWLRYHKAEAILSICEVQGKLESDTPISFSELRRYIGYLENDWDKFLYRYDQLDRVSSRGRLYGLEACCSELHEQYRGYARAG